jgi:DNA repair protein RecN (Recombination protein N)
MLRELFIKDFAIIESLRICFDHGLTILSGETGAGKSIIIRAVNLLLGSRASTAVIRTGTRQAEVQGLFEVPPANPAWNAMQELGFDPGEGLLIRRVIAANNRHRVFINDRLVTAQALTALTQHLASISGQHAHQSLLKESLHLLMIDQFAGLTGLRNRVQDRFRRLLPLLAREEELIERQRRQNEHRELLVFQKQEILSAAIAPGEDEALEAERQRLRHAEELYALVYGSIERLYGDRGAVRDRVAEVSGDLQKAARIDAGLESMVQRLNDIGYRIEDVVQELRTRLDTLQVDENRLEEVEDRLDALFKLKRKYGGSLTAIENRLTEIATELSGIENLQTELSALRKRLDGECRELATAARSLSEKRAAAAGELASTMERELADLGMQHTRFAVDLRLLPATEAADPRLVADEAAITETGREQACFLIAPNVGEDLKPLAAIASGGELSRVVLALNAILAGTETVETIIFDEVDAGIGGAVAQVVGRKLTELTRRHQVICITHLPQIARFGDHHFRVSKEVRGGRTHTRFVPIEEGHRAEEIARMLGGEKITAATLAHAREMLATPRGNGKKKKSGSKKGRSS